MPAAQPYNPDFAPEVPRDQNQKIDPQNIDAEKSVLAACMLSQDAIDEVIAKLVPQNFYRFAHQTIFSSMLDLQQRHIPIDHISLADNLKAQGQLESIGGRAYLAELADFTSALTNWRNHADIVKRTSMLRDLSRAGSAISALAYDAPDDLDVVVEEAEKTLFGVTEKRVSSSFEKMDVLVQNAYCSIQELKRNKGQFAGVPSGFADIDNLFGGFRGGELIILAARPAVGKTAFALNLATNAARMGSTVAFLSLEMSKEQIVQRILAAEARIALSNIRSGNITDADEGAIIQAASTVSMLPMFLDDTTNLSILELRAKARRELRGIDKGIIIVDYLQLMQPPRSRSDGNRAVEVAEISRGLKVLAKELNMPVIALSQLSRSIEHRGKDKRPMLSDLRESGAIEQDADIVMFLDRSTSEEEALLDSRPDLGTAKLIVAKHRNGATRDITLSFVPEFTKFGDYYDESRIVQYE